MKQFVNHVEKLPQFLGQTLFSEIVGTPEGKDLEHLFEELDEWSRKGYSEQGTSPSAPAPPGYGAVSRKPLIQRLAESANGIQEDLRREVFNEYRDFQPQFRQTLIQRYEALLGVLSKGLDLRNNPLVIFTTNYDPAIETFCQANAGEYRLCDGFVQQWNAGSPVWQRDSIHQLQIGATNQKDVVLFKLHGSTSWFKRGNQFIKSDATIYTGNDPSFENLLIYPAKRKVALEDPYFTGYDYFQRTLENCQLCVVIGYSFRDYDALSRLRSAASYNRALKLLVIDLYADPLCKRLKDLGVNAKPLVQVFGPAESEQGYLSAIRAELGIEASTGRPST